MKTISKLSNKLTSPPQVILQLTSLLLATHALPDHYHAPAEPEYHAPVYKEHKEEPKPYHYSYGVHDEYSGSNFDASEHADGSGAVVGSYSVALPDGRTQHVKYHADHYNGYVAEVTYEGVAHYPEYHHGDKYGHGGYH